MTRSFQIAVIEGDGIGPEVTAEAIRAADAAAARENDAFQWIRYPWGTDYYLAQRPNGSARFSRLAGEA